MNINTKLEKKEFQKLIECLFSDARFDGFSFDMFFTLKFERNKKIEYMGAQLPNEFQIRIQSGWWFDSEEEWNQKVRNLTIYELVEPDEPVKAYELACIRWREGSNVNSVILKDDKVVIKFDSGKSISILLYAEMDYSWVLRSVNTVQSAIKFEIICEDNEFYLNIS